MKFKKLIAGAAAGAALAFGGVTGGMILAPATAMAQGFEGHWEHCTGQYDGQECWGQGGGVIQHLDLP